MPNTVDGVSLALIMMGVVELLTAGKKGPWAICDDYLVISTCRCT
jgi:hypothetical protein